MAGCANWHILGMIAQIVRAEDRRRMTLLVPKEIVARTIDILRRGGAAECEAVVLWLGSGPRGAERIEDAYRPDQKALIEWQCQCGS